MRLIHGRIDTKRKGLTSFSSLRSQPQSDGRRSEEGKKEKARTLICFAVSKCEELELKDLNRTVIGPNYIGIRYNDPGQAGLASDEAQLLRKHN